MIAQPQGRVAINPQTGERVIVAGPAAAPVAQPSAPVYQRPQLPATIEGPPREAPLQAPLQEESTRVGIARTQQQMAQEATPEQARQMTQLGIQRAQTEVAKAMEEQAARERARQLPGGGQASVEQGRAGSFALRMRRANQLYEQQNVGAPSIGLNIARSVLPDSITNSFIVPAERQAAEAAQRDWVSAALRFESGAAIPSSEIDNHIRMYFPQPGDTEQTIAQKAQMRRTAEQAMIAAAGPMGAWAEDQSEEAQNSTSGTNMSRGVYLPTGAPPRQADNQAAIRDIEDPVRRGYAMEIQGMFNDPEIGNAEILAYTRRHFGNEVTADFMSVLDRRSDPNSDESRAMAQGRKPFAVDPGWFTTQREATGVEQTLGAMLDTAPGTAATHYANSAMAGWLPDAAGLVGVDPETVRAGMEGQRMENPVAAIGGDIAGAVGAFGAAGRVARNANFMQASPGARMLAGDAAYGASYGAASNPDDRLGGATTGAILQGTGGVAGRAGVRAVGNVARGVTDPAVRRLADAGVPLTAGMAAGQSGVAGQAVRAVENASTSLPVVGRQVTQRHVEARTRFSQNTWNEALRPIGGRVDNVGEEAAEAARTQVSAAYQRVFNGRSFTLDRPMQGVLTGQARSARRLLPDFRGDVEHIITQQVRPMLQQGDVQSALRVIKEGRSAIAARPGSDGAVRSLGTIEASLQRMIQRQHPGAYRELRNADRAHRLVSTAQMATQAAINNVDTPGIFTPAQLGQAARQNARTFGGRDLAASTRRPFYQSQRDAQTVLPNTIPDSGTAGRATTNALLLGAGGAATYADQPGVGAGIGALGALSLLNSRGGQRLVRGMLTGRSQGARDLGDRIVDQPLTIPFSPQRSAPFTAEFTAPTLSGVGVGSALNSLFGEQSEYRVPW